MIGSYGEKMLRLTLRNLFARKVRLLMSTFAIVLGVAFVAGSLIFSDTLSRSFTALFSSTVEPTICPPTGRPASVQPHAIEPRQVDLLHGRGRDGIQVAQRIEPFEE